LKNGNDERNEKNMNEVHHTKASSFADDADLAAFRRAKAKGMSDQQAFKLGDNGVGCWGDSCASGSGPRCALPPEDWKLLIPHARGAKVRVCANGHEVVCELRDRMPAKATALARNGCGIDLNPDAAAVLGLRPPFIVDATWQFV